MPVLLITPKRPSLETSTEYGLTPVTILSFVTLTVVPSMESTAAPFSSRRATIAPCRRA